MVLAVSGTAASAACSPLFSTALSRAQCTWERDLPSDGSLLPQTKQIRSYRPGMLQLWVGR